MKRILEPELMVDEDQVRAYAEADFDEPHAHFIELFKDVFSAAQIAGYALDLGCGPGDITFRFAESFPQCTIEAVDGSATMLEYARRRQDLSGSIGSRIRFMEGMLPHLDLPRARYDYLISNSLLHHLPNADSLWSVIKQYSGPGSGIFIMDLCRPTDTTTANQLVETYAANEPEVLRRDFYNSLLAAFTLDEIAAQLQAHQLPYLVLERTSDRHLTISGRIL